MSNSHSIWCKLDRYPPVLVRLLARTGKASAMSDAEIAFAGNLPIAEVKRLSYLTDWDSVPVGLMKKFCLACGVDFADRETMRTLNRYTARDSAAKFVHLQRHRDFPQFREMLRVYLASVSK